MAAADTPVRGHTVFGHAAAGPTRTAWGRTGEEAVTLQFAVTTVDLYSSQSKMPEDTGITRVESTLAVNGIDGSLTNIGRMLGMPDSSHNGGDLTALTDEALDFNDDDVGEQERWLYSLGPGPLNSTRTIDAFRCKVSDVQPLMQAKTDWMLPQASWRMLRPTSGPFITITDDLGT